MGDRSSGWIQIGGVLPTEHLNEFVQLIWNEGCGPDWGEQFSGPDEIRTYIEEWVGGLVYLCAHDISGGEFDTLEDKLCEWGLCYLAGWESGAEYNSGMALWRPEFAGTPNHKVVDATADGSVLISLDDLRAAVAKNAVDALIEDCEAFDDARLPRFTIAGLLGREAIKVTEHQ